ncbi:MAG TPA: response regulator [Gemmatimonadales bacterium]|jgi:CheY-like chemotaxis protein|nr:response regulator [Gemmatimonadales bacterium]
MSATHLQDPNLNVAFSNASSRSSDTQVRAILAELLNRSRLLDYAIAHVETATAGGGRPAQREALKALYHTLQVYALDVAQLRAWAQSAGLVSAGSGYNEDWLAVAQSAPAAEERAAEPARREEPRQENRQAQEPRGNERPAPKQPREPQPIDGVRGGTEKVLLVDPDEARRELSAATLRGLGYRVHDAGSGEEALGHLTTNGDEVHLLLSAVQLPGVTGPQLAESVATWHPGVRVLFMHGQEGPSGLDQLPYRAWAIEQPLRPSELARSVRDVLDA